MLLATVLVTLFYAALHFLALFALLGSFAVIRILLLVSLLILVVFIVLIVLVLIVLILILLIVFILVVLVIFVVFVVFVVLIIFVIGLFSLLLLLLRTIMRLISISSTTLALLILLILRRGRRLTGGNDLPHLLVEGCRLSTVTRHRGVTLLFQSERKVHSHGALVGIGFNAPILNLSRLGNTVPRGTQLLHTRIDVVEPKVFGTRVVVRNPARRPQVPPVDLARIGGQRGLVIARTHGPTRGPGPQGKRNHIGSNRKRDGDDGH